MDIDELEKALKSSKFRGSVREFFRNMEGADAFTEAALDAYKEKDAKRLAYNAAYQRDLRKVKKLGLNCTVAEYREQKESER